MTKITKVRNIHTGEIRFYQDRKSAYVENLSSKMNKKSYKIMLLCCIYR